jgi:hypothetical protein
MSGVLVDAVAECGLLDNPGMWETPGGIKLSYLKQGVSDS